MGFIKKLINCLYGILQRKNYNLFIKEAEFRYNVREKNKKEIFILLKDIFKIIYDKNKFDINVENLN